MSYQNEPHNPAERRRRGLTSSYLVTARRPATHPRGGNTTVVGVTASDRTEAQRLGMDEARLTGFTEHVSTVAVESR